MSTPVTPKFIATDLDAIAGFEGRVAVLMGEEGKLDQGSRRVNKLMRGALARLTGAEEFDKMKEAEARDFAYPNGLTAEAVQAVRLSRRAGAGDARRAGAAIGKAAKGKPVLVLAGNLKHLSDLALGLVLRCYEFSDHKTSEVKSPGPVTVMCTDPEAAQAAWAEAGALAEGVFFTRDLVNEPANVLTTVEFARRLEALKKLGVKVQVLDEGELEKLGMRTLLAVGQGSASPSKVVVMEWTGGGKETPFALVGKGVVFDTGGISMKPAAGMEDMTMDMGGAGVVAGVM